MPQITLESMGLQAPIIIEIPNEKIGETEWKRKEQVQKLEWQPATKVTFVHTLIIPYEKLEGDLYGEPIIDKVKIQEAYQIADNATIVDMQGNYLLKNVPGDVSEHEVEGGVLYNVNWMREGDFFTLIANTQDIRVADMVRAKVLSNMPGFYHHDHDFSLIEP